MVIAIKTDSEILTELGGRLRSYRLQMNLTQTELATRAGVSRTTIRDAELGKDSQPALHLGETPACAWAVGQPGCFSTLALGLANSVDEAAGKAAPARQKVSRWLMCWRSRG